MASVSDVSKKSWMRFVFVSLIHEKPINGALPKSHMSRITKKLKNDDCADGEGKDWLTALLLCLFLGYLGIHRFYTKHIVIGVVQLLTMGGCGVWALIDLIQIITESYKDADGHKLVKK